MATTSRAALNGQKLKFASLLAIGMEQTEAYRQCFYTKGIKANTISTRASKLANKEAIKDSVASFLSELKIDQLDSAGRAYTDLLNSIAKCEKAENWTAYAQLMRQRLSCLGLLKENINLSAEQKFTDAELIKRLTKGDPGMAAMVKNVLGEGDAYRQ